MPIPKHTDRGSACKQHIGLGIFTPGNSSGEPVYVPLVPFTRGTIMARVPIPNAPQAAYANINTTQRAQTRERLAREGRSWADMTRENFLRKLNARQVDRQLTGRGVGATAPPSQAQIRNTSTTSRNGTPVVPRS